MLFFHQVRKTKTCRIIPFNSISDIENPYQSIAVDRNIVYFFDVSLWAEYYM